MKNGRAISRSFQCLFVCLWGTKRGGEDGERMYVVGIRLRSCQGVDVINVAAVQNDINHFYFFWAASAY